MPHYLPPQGGCNTTPMVTAEAGLFLGDLKSTLPVICLAVGVLMVMHEGINYARVSVCALGFWLTSPPIFWDIGVGCLGWL